MMARVKQVLVMHFARYFVLRMIGMALLAAIFAFGILSRAFEDTGISAVVLAGALPGVFLASSMMVSAKWEFATYKARLLPHFAEAHLLVLVCGVSLTSVVIPGAVATWAGASLVGALAYALLNVALATWAYAVDPSPMHRALLSSGVFFSGMYADTAMIWFSPALDYNLLRVAILLAATAGMGIWFYRLPRSIEKNDGFTLRVLARPNASEHLEALESRRFEAWKLGWLRNWLIDWWHDRLEGIRATSVAQRQRLLSYGDSPFAVLPSFASVLVGMLSLVGVISFCSGGDPVQDSLSVSAGAILLVGTFGVSLFPLTSLATRRPRMGQELLFPWTRREYINGLFKRSIVSAAVADAMCGILLLLLWGGMRQLEGWGGPKLSTMLVAGIGIVLFQLYLFGCSLHVARADSAVVRVSLIIVSVLVLFASVYFFSALYDALGPLIGGAALAVVGVGGLLWGKKARDEWLLEELG